MRRRTGPTDGDMLAGTLDMLILRILQAGAAHGLQIAQNIERRSDDVLLVEQGSLYPALHRIEERGWIASYWGVSDTNRKAKFYAITRTGRRQLTDETRNWERIAGVMSRLLRTTS